MTNELKPCPFCGCKATFVKHSAGVYGTQGFDKWDAVACKQCRATVGACDRRFRCRNDARDVWNRRATPPSTVPTASAGAGLLEHAKEPETRMDTGFGGGHLASAGSAPSTAEVELPLLPKPWGEQMTAYYNEGGSVLARGADFFKDQEIDEWRAWGRECARRSALASSTAAGEAKDAARYRVLRRHVAPRDISLSMTVPVTDIPPDQAIEERIDMLCDIEIARSAMAQKEPPCGS